jgi:hypothetical protein
MSLESQLASLITSIGTDWKNLWAKIGTGSLDTTATNLVAAINEVKVTADSAGGTVPDATTTVKGKVELATDAETLALTDTVRAITPSNLASILNVNNGIPKLDSGGKVAAAQLPAYVDDVLEYANQAAFPGTGATSIIYVALDTNKVYRWTGSVYVEISASPGTTDAVTEGTTNLYFTNTRADARATSIVGTLVGDTTTDLVALYTTAKA